MIILVNCFFVFKSYCLIMKIFTKICSNVYVFWYINRGEVFARFITLSNSSTQFLKFWGCRQVRQGSQVFLLILRIRRVVFFDNKSMISQCAPFQKLHHFRKMYFQVSKHFSRTFGLCKSNFSSFESCRFERLFVFFLGNTSLAFHQNHQIYCPQHASHLFHFSQVLQQLYFYLVNLL